MKQVVIESAGGYERLQIQEREAPTPQEGEVLIDCRAAGVNFADCCVRMGIYSSAKKYVGWPITPGFEVAGVVSDVGGGVTRFKKGDRVFAVVRFGGYAEKLSAPESQVYDLPDSLTFEQGASFPAVYLTAYYALFYLAHPRKGDTLLVHSAAGGVGSALVQLGKGHGCRVIGVVGSSHKVDYLQSLGIDGVIDKSKEDLWKKGEEFSPGGYDVILDANGAETLRESYGHLTAGGKLVVYGFHSMLSKGRGKPNWLKVLWDYWRTPRFNPLEMTGDNHSVLAFNLSYLFDRMPMLHEAIEAILSEIEEGRVALDEITPYPFEKVADAHRDLESGQTTGKLVLVMGAK